MISAFACLALPKLLSMLLSCKTRLTQPSLIDSPLNTARNKIEVTTFPYCTVYPLTGSQFCKFSPKFCSQCSPNLGE